MNRTELKGSVQMTSRAADPSLGVLLGLVVLLDKMSDYLDELLFLWKLGLSIIIFQLVYFEQGWALAPLSVHQVGQQEKEFTVEASL